MLTYRKLTFQQSVQVARQLIEYGSNQALRAFLDDFYGPDSYSVDIEVEHGKYGDTIQHVGVFTLERQRVLPTLSLPAWQDLLVEDREVFDPTDKEDDQIAAIGPYMVQHNVYLDYGIDPVDEVDLRIEAGYLATPPELYLLEVAQQDREAPVDARKHAATPPPGPAFTATLRTALQRMEQLSEQATQVAAEINQLYAGVSRDSSPPDQMVTHARLHCLSAAQQTEEAMKYLAFVCKELSSQQPSA